MCKKLTVKCIYQGEPTVEEKLEIKKAVLRENDNDIRKKLRA